ncbi:MAG: DegT/DnrJ/EryC1/StrS family aminotransferase, partial [Promethearchaeota archaeon]
HLYVIRTKQRDELRKWLKSRGILTDVHYPTPIHLQKAYSDLQVENGSLPVTEQYASQILSLPMYPELKEEEITQVADAINGFRFLNGGSKNA